MNRAYAFVALTVGLTVYGQLIIKWQAKKAGPFPDGARDRLDYLGHFLINPWVISSLAGAVVAAFAWIAALSRLDLSTAYPFVAASFALVLILSAIVFDERLTVPKIVGAVLILLGLIIGSQG
jgi:multidrug transporter EmrE-like cation transporter